MIISSDTTRARSTTQAAAEAAGSTGKILLENLSMAQARPTSSPCFRTVSEAGAGIVMIVGTILARALVTELTGEDKDFPTAALAQILLPIERWRDLDVSTRGRCKGSGGRKN